MIKKITIEEVMREEPHTMTVYKAHPKKEGILQKFIATVTKDEEKKNIIEPGEPVAEYRLAEPGEKVDATIYSQKHSALKSYVKI